MRTANAIHFEFMTVNVQGVTPDCKGELEV